MPKRTYANTHTNATLYRLVFRIYIHALMHTNTCHCTYAHSHSRTHTLGNSHTFSHSHTHTVHSRTYKLPYTRTRITFIHIDSYIHTLIRPHTRTNKQTYTRYTRAYLINTGLVFHIHSGYFYFTIFVVFRLSIKL